MWPGFGLHFELTSILILNGRNLNPRRLKKCSINSKFGQSSSKKQFSPRVSVLISDLLLHLCVRQGLQQGAPLVGIPRVSDGDLHCWQGVFTAKTNRKTRVSSLHSTFAAASGTSTTAVSLPGGPNRHQAGERLPEGVRPLVPAQLAADAVCDGGDKLSAQAQLRAELQGKLLRRVLPLGHVPLKLVHQGDVAHVDVELWSDRAAGEWRMVATEQRRSAGRRWAPWWWPSGRPGPPGCCLWGTTRSAAGWRRRWRGRRPAGWGLGHRKGSRQTSPASSASLSELRKAGIYSASEVLNPNYSWCHKIKWCQDATVHVPGESVPQLLTLDLHVQADRDQNFWLRGVLVDHSWVVVIEAVWDRTGCQVGSNSSLQVASKAQRWS